MIALATAVAAELSALRGTPWHARASEHDAERLAEIVRFDGARLLLRADGAHVEISGRFPYGHEPYGPITRGSRTYHERIPFVSRVSPTREPRLIARHLVRVLVERYEAAYSAAARSASASRRQDDEDAAFLAAVAAAGDGRVAGGPGTGRDGVAVVGRLVVRPIGASGAECEVRGTLPREVALRVAGMLREGATGAEILAGR